MRPNQIYAWEDFPEYRATEQYGRCLGRILARLPGGPHRRATRTLIRGAVLMAKSICGAHAELRHDQLSGEHRELFRQTGLECVAVSRDGLMLLKREGLGSKPDLLAALELLERIEYGLRSRPLPD